jgi:hypothetical protein
MKIEKTFLITPALQVRHIFPLESSPSVCSLWVLSPHLMHSYS